MDNIIKNFLETPLRFSSSSSSDESDDSILLSDENVPQELRAKTASFFEVTVHSYSDEDYRRQFRMHRGSVSNLLNIFEFEKMNVGGWPRISKEKSLHIFLWYLANTNSFREVADKFDITESACHGIVSSLSKKLTEVAENFIKFPPRQQFDNTSETFQEHGGVPLAIGAIDCTHFQIPKPDTNPEDYCNRKSYYSIILQGIVGSRKQFYDIYVGEPGGLHDSSVLRRSPIYEIGNNANFFEHYYVLADSAYPSSLCWIVPPFKDFGNLTENQKLFNKQLSGQRVVIEHAFGLLKGRWRRLHQFKNLSKQLIVNCITAACVLHNFCILLEDDDGEDFQISDPELIYQEFDEIEPRRQVTKRDEIFYMIFNQ